MEFLEKPFYGYKRKGWLLGLLYAGVVLVAPIILLFVLVFDHLLMLVAIVLVGIALSAFTGNKPGHADMSESDHAWDWWESFASTVGPYIFIWVFLARDALSVLVLVFFSVFNVATIVRGFETPER